MGLASFVAGGMQGFDAAQNQKDKELQRQMEMEQLYRYRSETPLTLDASRAAINATEANTALTNYNYGVTQQTAPYEVGAARLKYEGGVRDNRLDSEISKLISSQVRAKYTKQQLDRAMNQYIQSVPQSADAVNAVLEQQGRPERIVPGGIDYGGQIYQADELQIRDYLGGKASDYFGAAGAARANHKINLAWPYATQSPLNSPVHIAQAKAAAKQQRRYPFGQFGQLFSSGGGQ